MKTQKSDGILVEVWQRQSDLVSILCAVKYLQISYTEHHTEVLFEEELLRSLEKNSGLIQSLSNMGDEEKGPSPWILTHEKSNVKFFAFLCPLGFNMHVT